MDRFLCDRDFRRERFNATLHMKYQRDLAWSICNKGGKQGLQYIILCAVKSLPN